MRGATCPQALDLQAVATQLRRPLFRSMAAELEYLRKVGIEVSSSSPTHVFTRGVSSTAQAAPRGENKTPQQSEKKNTSPKNGNAFGKDLRGKGFDKEAVIRNSHPPWLVPNSGKDKQLHVANSLTGAKESFRPLNGNKVLWYTCGPTVYDVSHMGHARTYLTFDILRRIMVNYFGYDVKYQINITDIDDKIILKSRQNSLFDDFTGEASKMTPAELRKVVEDALIFAEDKLKKKTPVAPEAGASPKDQHEFETLKQEHQLKMQQHTGIAKKVKDALQSGNVDAVLSAARDVLMAKLDKDRGHTVTDHSIFEAHARKYEDEYFADMDALGILRPDVVTRITRYMDGRVQKFIERLEELGVAYCSAGSVYFDIDVFQSMGYHYRKLVPAMCASAKEMEEGEGALAAEDAEKRNPNDFALWKKSKPGEPAWESKWGPGRPGWHIECSVMATDINGEYLDIHAGGEDLKFPHHDNEMAQSEAYLKRSQWTNYFWHAGHLHIEGLKMSKSLKNFITIRQALAVHTARQIRWMFLMQAWDKGISYSDQAVDMARSEERKFKHFLSSLDFWSRRPHGKAIGDREAKLEASLAACKETVHAGIIDNFSTPRVMEALSKLTSECKVSVDALPDASLDPVLRAAELIEKTLSTFGVEGLKGNPAEGSKEAWTEALDAFADLRQEIRNLARNKASSAEITSTVEKATPAVEKAKKSNLMAVASLMETFQTDLRDLAAKSAPTAELLKRCDLVRDVEFVSLGIRLEDRDAVGSCPYVWMFDEVDALKAEQREQEEKAREAAQAKIQNKLDQKLKEIKSTEKAAVDPKELFRSGGNAGFYSAFDDTGVPTKLASGEEVSAKKKKDLAKEMAKQVKDYEKLQKQAEAEGIDAILQKMRKDAEELEKQLQT